jgi:gluconokinase
MERQENVILACSALTEDARRRLGAYRPGVKLVYLKGTFDQIRQRLLARTDHFMPPDLLKSQFQALEEPASAWVVEIGPAPEEIASQIAALVRQ